MSPRRMTPSQLQSELRRLQRQQQQNIDRANREIKRVNDHNKRVFAHNQKVINDYNRKARTHNSRVRADRQRLLRELNRLNARPVTTRYVTYSSSARVVQEAFVRVEQVSAREEWFADDELFEMAEREAANSAATLNVLLDEPNFALADNGQLRQTVITTELLDFSQDLHDRWQGALYALSSENPDAARQFCTSSREILVTVLDLHAPDNAVLASGRDFELTEAGRVPRREKIYYCLAQGGQQIDALADFVHDDINNVMDLFASFNPATHGEAGRYDIVQLGAIKTRVEGAILFLHRVVMAA